MFLDVLRCSKYFEVRKGKFSVAGDEEEGRRPATGPDDGGRSQAALERCLGSEGVGSVVMAVDSSQHGLEMDGHRNFAAPYHLDRLI